MGYNKVLTLYILNMENKDKLLPVTLALSLVLANCNTLPQKTQRSTPKESDPQISEVNSQTTELPEADPAAAPVVYIEKEEVESEITPEVLIVKTDKLGTYRTLWNNDLQMYTLSFDLSHQVEPGEKTLEDLKKEGGSISLVTPFEAVVNCSGGANDKFYVDGEEWNLGNPAEDDEGEFVVEAGQEIKGVWEAGNDSAGLEIHFPKTGLFLEEYPRVVPLDIQTEQEQKEFTPQDFLINLQELGTYKFGFDTNLNKYVLPISQKHLVSEGSMDLEDVKREGGEFVFSLPWDITLNSITGKITANGKELINGNPVILEDGTIELGEYGVYHIPANELIRVIYEAYNPSNGFQIIIDWPKK